MKKILNNPDGAKTRNPQTVAREAMRPKPAKRFYRQAIAVEEPGDQENAVDGERLFAIHLDGKKLKTPAGNTLLLPTRKIAQIVADEWAAQKENIDPAVMPATRLVNTALDGIANDPQAVIEDMLKFASSDLLCYRASQPQGLVQQQTRHWDPVLDWMEEELCARFELTQALVRIVQPREAVAAVNIALRQWQDPIAIAALHTFTNLTGSIILALAIAKEKLTAGQAWKIAHVDEDWNISLWGEDYEAMGRRENRWKEMDAASRLFFALRQG